MSDLYDTDLRPPLEWIRDEPCTPPWWLLAIPAALILALALWLL